MIRLLLLAWCSVVLMAMARGEEMRERVYYVGVQDPRYWDLVDRDEDPFSESDVGIKKLDKMPFQSSFFSKGDSLWDVSTDLRKVMLGTSLLERAIFNQTSGRLVIRGNEKAHSDVGFFARKECVDLSMNIDLTVRVYRRSLQTNQMSQWDGIQLFTDKSFEFEQKSVARLREEVVTSIGDSSFETQLSVSEIWDDELLTLDLKLNSKMEGKAFELATNLLLLNEVPTAIELGAIGGNEALILVLRPEIQFLDGTKWSDRVLDARGVLLKPNERFQSRLPRSGWQLDEETGKSARFYPVPSTFLGFIDGPRPGSGPVLHKPGTFPVLTSSIPEMKARPEDRVLDLRSVFKGHGVDLGMDDVACMLEGGLEVYFEVEESQVEHIDDIVWHSKLEAPRMIVGSFSLIEGDEKIEAAEIDQAHIRCLAKASFACRPGKKTKLKLEKGDLRLLLDGEFQVGLEENLVDMRAELVLSEGNQSVLQWKSGATLNIDRPKIVHSYQKNGKWSALVVEVKWMNASEWVTGE